MAIVFLSLGSSLGDREKTLKDAVKDLDAFGTVKKVSSLHAFAPYGGVAQHEFLNLALEFQTELSPLNLLQAIHSIESKYLRTRETRWADRTLDIDIITYNNQEINTQELTIPHKECAQRDFVLIPLKEITQFKIRNHKIYIIFSNLNYSFIYKNWYFTLTEKHESLVSISVKECITTHLIPHSLPSTPLLEKAEKELREYMEGGNNHFTFSYSLEGITPFTLKVLSALQNIPSGAQWTYGQLARYIGSPKAVRAVGSALRKNPLPFIYPCHRVVPTTGGIGKYSAGGEQMKQILLKNETEKATS